MKFTLKIVSVISLLLMIIIPAYSFTGRTLDTKDITKDAEDIVIADCVSKKAVWVGGHIETTVKIKVKESLKGVRKADEEIEITQMGGEITDPPIGQFVAGMPQFFEGEKSLLFLSSKRDAKPAAKKSVKNPKSKLGATPYVVGLDQGKWTLITSQSTGKQYAVRYRLDKLNLAPSDELNSRIAQAIAKQDKLLASGLIDTDNIVLTPEVKKNLEVKQEQVKSQNKKNSAAASSSKDSKTVKDSKSISDDQFKFSSSKKPSDNVKTLEDFRKEIKANLKDIKVK